MLDVAGASSLRMSRQMVMPSTETRAPEADGTGLSSPTEGNGVRQPIIVQGRTEPMGAVPFHGDGPLTRWLMASAALHPDINCHIAIHQFSDVKQGRRDYCEVHIHDYDEINVFHTPSALRVAVRLGDETVQVDAPATVFIPAGTPHAANVTFGSGFMVAVLLDGRFRAVSGA